MVKATIIREGGFESVGIWEEYRRNENQLEFFPEKKKKKRNQLDFPSKDQSKSEPNQTQNIIHELTTPLT